MESRFFAENKKFPDNFVPDHSSLIGGIVTKLILSNEIPELSKIYIHKTLVSFIEKEAFEGKAVGLAGIEELQRIRELAKERNIEVEIVGDSQRVFSQVDILELSRIVRELAISTESVLITSDKIASQIAQAMGIKTLYVPASASKRLKLEDFFDNETMSVHLIEDVPPIAKKGRPGSWSFVQLSDKPITRAEIQSIFDEIVETAKSREDSFIEIDRSGSTIVQLGAYRIVIVRPPLGSKWMITAVKPLVKLSLEDYMLPEKLLERFKKRAEGILIAGAPGMGKTTFAQALAEFYQKEGKIVTTIESPRDMRLSPQIVQYSKHFAEKDEIHDILLLSRPDYTFFDELRGDDDFKLYVDLRLAGIGMVGVLHATSPIDAIQRFINRVELGVIPSIIDTVIFIDRGQISKVYEITITVKLPTGLKEVDLARPVIEVKDFLTSELEYEIYTFGEQTVVVPIKRGKKVGAGEERIIRQIETLVPGAEVEILGKTATVKLSGENSRLIMKRAKRLKRIAQKMGYDLRIETE
ncbi:Flp pilus assembly complex ATPase component TadA [Fervidicoccus fontis]|uniref:Flp pilus assembly complex ATPase component TadA n=1 Tax=Fervidicoccus fontis TaxID=683846 RepID=A0A843AG65_9CREN|nr:PINc/VapC family ATPase [Fervidicoccus fontis]MBE9390500.1 Flp pilus assembly complex ATPase component TadA [Fervidicoccus fontis]